jgi:hypothetical protein
MDLSLMPGCWPKQKDSDVTSIYDFFQLRDDGSNDLEV